MWCVAPPDANAGSWWTQVTLIHDQPLFQSTLDCGRKMFSTPPRLHLNPHSNSSTVLDADSSEPSGATDVTSVLIPTCFIMNPSAHTSYCIRLDKRGSACREIHLWHENCCRNKDATERQKTHKHIINTAWNTKLILHPICCIIVKHHAAWEENFHLLHVKSLIFLFSFTWGFVTPDFSKYYFTVRYCRLFQWWENIWQRFIHHILLHLVPTRSVSTSHFPPFSFSHPHYFAVLD